MDATTGWMFLTRWGNSILLLPVAACLCIALWAGGERRVALHWACVFAGAVVVVLATKLAFLGWGIGSRRFDFTGISGHSTLAAAVLPMLAWWLVRGRAPAVRRTVLLAAWIVALGVGVSRVRLSAHSVSEVVAGLALGTLVAWAVIPRQHVARRQSAFRWALLAALVFAGMLPDVGESDEAHGLIVRVALHLSGRAEPFTRETF